MMAIHTHGQWLFESCGGVLVIHCKDSMGADCHVAEVLRECDGPLIAAAPELLAALKAFVDPWSKGGDWHSKITYDTYNNARTVIAKATGGAA